MSIPINVFLNIIFSLLDLLKGGFVFSLVLFPLVFVGSYLREKVFEKRFSWMTSCLLSSFALAFAIFLLAYFSPYVSAIPKESLGIKPPELDVGFFGVVKLIAFGLFKILIVSLFFAFASVPFIVLGAIVVEYLTKHKFNKYFSLFIATYGC